jgi:heavy metal sensor kinase
MKSLPIRWKLTLWYGFAVSVTLFAFAFILLILTRQQLLNRTDTALREELRELALEVRINLSESDFARSANARFFHHDIYDFAVINQKGQHIFLSAGLTGHNIPEIVPDNLSSEICCATCHISDTGMVRVAGFSCESGFGPLTVLAVTSLNPLIDEMYALQKMMAILLPLAIASALVGGLFLAKRALAPVNAIVQLAKSITIDTLDRRVDVPNPRDEIGQLAATLNSLIERLELAVHEIKRFTADASHEIRTPLAALRMEAELALRSNRSPEQYQCALRVVVDEATRLGKLADQLLNLSRLDAGIVRTVRAHVRLDAIVRDVTEQLQPVAEHRGVFLRADNIESCQVEGDDADLRQVLSNVVENALKYTDRGGSVQVQCSAERNMAVFQVTDTGIGISGTHLPHIFDRFYRVDASRHRDSGGAGLGLSIARMTVLGHGGSIDIRSELQTGTTVIIRLPLTEEQEWCPGELTEWTG